MPRVKSRKDVPDYFKDLQTLRRPNLNEQVDPEMPDIAGVAQQLPAVMLNPKEIPDIRKLSPLKNIQFAKQAEQAAPGSTQQASAMIEADPNAEPLGSQRSIIPEATPQENTPFPYHLYAGMNNPSANLTSLKQPGLAPKAIENVAPPQEEQRGFPHNILPKGLIDYIENKPDTAEKLRSLRIAEEDLSPTKVQEPSPFREFLPEGFNQYLENSTSPSMEQFEKEYVNPQPKGVMSDRQYGLYNAMMPEVKALLPPDVKTDMKAYEQEKIAKFQENLKQTQNNGQPDLVPGSVEAIVADPTAAAALGKIAGVDINDTAIQEELKPYADLYDETDETLRAEKDAIKDRLENGKMTDRDYFMLGLAVLLPTIISGAFGGFEAAGAALAGGAGSVAESMKQAQKLEREDEKRLSEIEGERIENAEKLSDISEKIQKRQPKDKFAETYENTPTKVYTDPKTGQEKQYMQIDDVLWYDTSKMLSGDLKSNIKTLNKKVENAETKGGFVKVMLNKGNNLENIFQQLIDQEASTYTAALAGEIPVFGEKLKNMMSNTIIDPETGEEVTASVAIKGVIDKMRDSYRGSQPGKVPVLTGHQLEHFNAMIQNPYNKSAGVTAKEALNSVKRFNSIATHEFVDNMASQGFSRADLEKEYITPTQERRVEEKKTKKEKEKTKTKENILSNNPSLKTNVGSVVEIEE